MADVTPRTGAPIGRPRKFPDIVAFQAAIDAYFADCDVQKRPYTLSGLAVALDTTRRTLLDYEDGREDRQPADAPFVHALKQARARVEMWTAEHLLVGKGHPAGAIFTLKNNHGWRDEQQVQHTHALMVGSSLAPIPAEARPALSPALETRSALSLASEIVVSGEVVEAKGPPSEGVSPRSVA